MAKQTEEVNRFMKYFEGKLPGLMDFGLKIIIALIVFFIGQRIIKLLLKLLRRSFERAGMEEGSIHFLNSLCKAFFYVILVSSLATYFGVKEGSIAALLGSMGVGIILALKESLSNLAGGFILLLMKPFLVGDYIKEDSHGNEGTVFRIDLFYTTLITPDNRTVSVPNGILSNTSLTNITRQDKRQIRETIGISYGADIKKAKELLEHILNRDEAILRTEPIDVFVDELGDSAVQLGWRGWVAPEHYWTAKWRITEIMKYTFDENGIEIPFNQMDITIKKTQCNE